MPGERPRALGRVDGEQLGLLEDGADQPPRGVRIAREEVAAEDEDLGEQVRRVGGRGDDRCVELAHGPGKIGSEPDRGVDLRLAKQPRGLGGGGGQHQLDRGGAEQRLREAPGQKVERSGGLRRGHPLSLERGDLIDSGGRDEDLVAARAREEQDGSGTRLAHLVGEQREPVDAEHDGVGAAVVAAAAQRFEQRALLLQQRQLEVDAERATGEGLLAKAGTAGGEQQGRRGAARARSDAHRARGDRGEIAHRGRRARGEVEQGELNPNGRLSGDRAQQPPVREVAIGRVGEDGQAHRDEEDLAADADLPHEITRRPRAGSGPKRSVLSQA